jgi:crotonobetainyl-CoA:carnitine CoA-transferase CaiB-like acyl-CoA transferase
VIDALDLLDDERFADGPARRANREAFNAACNERLARGSVASWVRRLNEAGIPAGPVYAIDETFGDPQVQHLDVAERVDVVGGPDPASVAVLRYPVTLSATPARIRRGPPAAGADTRAVLGELGCTDASIDALLAQGAVAETVARPSWLS